MSIAIHIGDSRSVLSTLPDASVQMCVTSPPYFGLRDYGTASWEGGDAECDHKIPASTLGGGTNKGHDGSFTANYGQTCGKCGATRADRQIGLEGTVDAYVSALVTVFREVRRVLADDGTLWLNLGDSYVSTPTGGLSNKPSMMTGGRDNQAAGSTRPDKTNVGDGLKTKDLIGVPWRVAFALQADGWYLRQDIIWSKANPMPESVKDRCTKSHEYIFLLSKSPRYYYDAAAIAEDAIVEVSGPRFGGQKYGDSCDPHHNTKSGNVYTSNGKRNKRSVWTVATKPFSEAHFATFPPKLIEPCILAGSKKGDTVLDPFGGAATTGLVADRLERNAILIELNPEYANMGAERIRNDSPMFANVAVIA